MRCQGAEGWTNERKSARPTRRRDTSTRGMPLRRRQICGPRRVAGRHDMSLRHVPTVQHQRRRLHGLCSAGPRHDGSTPQVVSILADGAARVLFGLRIAVVLGTDAWPACLDLGREPRRSVPPRLGRAHLCRGLGSGAEPSILDEAAHGIRAKASLTRQVDPRSAQSAPGWEQSVLQHPATTSEFEPLLNYPQIGEERCLRRS